MSVCGVIPVFNGEATIALVVSVARFHLDSVLVIDDGSTDGTARAARDAGARVISLPKNKGKGHALKVGFQHVLSFGHDAALTLDADLQHDPREIPKFLDCRRDTGADLIIGNRLTTPGAIPAVRRVPNRVGNGCFSWITGQRILDSQCGYRYYHRRVLDTVPILTTGFETESDILCRAGLQGYQIRFVPVRAIYFTNGTDMSYYKPIRDTHDICMNFLRNTWWKHRRTKYHPWW